MTTTQDPVAAAAPPTASASAPASGRRPTRRQLAVAAAALAAVAALVAGWYGLHRPSAPSPPARSAPLTLPAAVLGLAQAPADADFGLQPTWLAAARAAGDGATITGRSYGSGAVRRQLRVVAGRADLAGILEFAWAADAGRSVDAAGGEAHCTSNLKLTASTPARVRPTALLCWRTTPALSAYAFLVDFDHHPTDRDGAAALDAVWSAALTGR